MRVGFVIEVAEYRNSLQQSSKKGEPEDVG